MTEPTLAIVVVSFLFVRQKEEQSDRERWQHLADLADFALAMKVTLMNINYQSFNNFMLRIGAYGVSRQLALEAGRKRSTCTFLQG